MVNELNGVTEFRDSMGAYAVNIPKKIVEYIQKKFEECVVV